MASFPCRLALRVRAQACKAEHRGGVLATASRKEQGVEGMVHWLPSCVSREVTLKAGCQRCIGVLSDGEGADGGGLPVAGTAKGWSCLVHPSALQGLAGYRVFSARASSQPLELINGPHSLSHLDPQLLPEGGDLPHPITSQLPPLGSCFPFFLSKPHCHLGAVLSPQSKGLAVCQTYSPTSGRFLHYLLQSAWAGPLLAGSRVQ